VNVRRLEAADEHPRWDAFVQRCPSATFFHRARWREVISECFGHPTYFLYTERDGQITGVLPLAHVRSWLFGRSLVSLPFCVYGGPAATDDDSRRALIEAASALARQLAVKHLELRNRSETPGLPVVSRYVTFRKAIAADAEANLKAVPRKQRAMIRKGMQLGLRVQPTTDIRPFYAVYAASLRNLGTPVLPKRYFAALARVFADDCEVLTVSREDRVVASVMSFYFRDEVLPYYGGGTPQARASHAYDFMYWNVMERAAARGVRLFDYGRSRIGTGSYRFKTHWGFEPEPLPYQYLLVQSSQLPNLSPDNPRFHGLINLWKKMPLGIANAIGPWLARSLG
jgi:FemAB-related protein (PEP-CTERM system-associated)